VLLLLGFAAPAFAVDGVIEINQAKVVAAGDFPFLITEPGSYRLTSNLDLCDLSAGVCTSTVHVNDNAITITAPNVTLDLNGFEIVDDPTGTGNGIEALAQNNVVVRNGTIRNRSTGVNLTGSHCRVQDIRAVDNSSIGISVGIHGTVSDSVSHSNGSNGILVGDHGTVSDSVATSNTLVGINVGDHATVSGSIANSNGSSGINAGSAVLVVDSIASDNGANGISVPSTAVDIAQNIVRVVTANNAEIGIVCGIVCTVRDSTSHLNSMGGISVGVGSHVAQCSVSHNGVTAISFGGNGSLRQSVFTGNANHSFIGSTSHGDNMSDGTIF
jgi:hypothetical protein